MRIVDAWASPLLKRPDRQALPEIQRLLTQSKSPLYAEGRAIREFGPDEMVELMDKGGVDIVLLSAWCRPEGWISTNDDVAEFVAEWPEMVARPGFRLAVARVSAGDLAGDLAGFALGHSVDPDSATSAAATCACAACTLASARA